MIRFWLAILFLIQSFLGFAQPVNNDPYQVIVKPVNDKYNYKLNEIPVFNVSVYHNKKIVENAIITYTIAPVEMDAVISRTDTLVNGMKQIIGATSSIPNYMRLEVCYVVDHVTYLGTSTVGIDTENLVAYTKEPEDFDLFWTKAIIDARKIDLEPLLVPLPEKDTRKKNAFLLRFNHGKNAFIYGILTIPKKSGKYPAVLHVPGAGVRSYPGMDYYEDIISLQIGIHGIPVNLYNSSIYENLQHGALYQYYLNRMDDRDKYYYKRVYTACVRAVDYLHSLPNFDGENIGVTGGSQGGALTIVTAALDSRVDAIAAYYPALSDLEAFNYGRAGGWPRLNGKSIIFNEQLIQVSRYYDVVNFAKRLRIPGFYAYGFNDNVCPPTSMTAMINAIESPKTVRIAPDAAHWMYPDIKESGKKQLYSILGVQGYK